MTYREAEPADETVMLLKYIMMVARTRQWGSRRWLWPETGMGAGLVGDTDLRTHGKALKTEMSTKALVMTPVAMTALCVMACCRMMSMILYTNQLPTVSLGPQIQG